MRNRARAHSNRKVHSVGIVIVSRNRLFLSIARGCLRAAHGIVVVVVIIMAVAVMVPVMPVPMVVALIVTVIRKQPGQRQVHVRPLVVVPRSGMAMRRCQALRQQEEHQNGTNQLTAHGNDLFGKTFY